jgi:EAL domain-containing protein (putative c-di-GMP-specific phosphodiesterase class I)
LSETTRPSHLNANPPSSDCPVEEIARSGRILTRWQPLCSIKKKSIIGYEALSSGLDKDGNLISPVTLFAAAGEKRLVLELDRLCRTKAIENFRHVHERYPDVTLFMNLDTSIIDRGVVGSGHLSRVVERVGLDPKQIVVEIIESRTANLSALKEFIETYRRYGFLIALDDVGAGHSNLDRIALLKPDIIKIDRMLVSHLHEYHSREVFRALANLAHATGALVVAEGMEEEQKALMSLELGADLLQGYYLAVPQTLNDDLVESVAKVTGSLAQHFRERILENMRKKADLRLEFKSVQNRIAEALRKSLQGDFDTALANTLADLPTVDFAYVLSDSGVQVSKTVANPRHDHRPKHYLFEPAEPGADHGLKDYVLMLNAEVDICVTEPYISLATGGLCQTLSARFSAVDSNQYILCIDFALPETPQTESTDSFED